MAEQSPERGVIFDMDGVLLRTDEYHYQSWREMADELGVSFSRQTFDQRMRGVERSTALAIFLESAPGRFDDAQSRELLDEKNRRFFAILEREGIRPLDGVMALIDALRRRRVPIGVGSSSRNTRRLLQAAGLASLVEAVVDANDAPGKPSPDIFLSVAKALRRSPADCVVIEDAFDGIEAARRAGMAVVAVGDRERLGEQPNFVPTLEGIDVDWLLSLPQRRLAT
ncbi:MAG: beta-phosphoglucomutase family hydrolase [Pirellulales bacterium]|nr:beta-phosphoglucomutase family hydrolase [Pirellulales bacterium]